MIRSVQLAATLSLSTVALSGCGGDPVPGQAISAPTSKQGLAPPINHPLSADKFKDRPCDLLTPAQREGIGATGASKPEDSILGPSCVWRAKEVGEDAAVDATLYTKPEAIKWERFFEEKDRNAFFELAGELAGSPAVHTNDEKTAERGGCTTHLGLSKDLMMEVSVNLALKSPDYRTPCRVSDRMATMVIENIKAGG